MGLIKAAVGALGGVVADHVLHQRDQLGLGIHVPATRATCAGALLTVRMLVVMGMRMVVMMAVIVGMLMVVMVPT